MSKALDRALEADREQRFPDMAAFLGGLKSKSNMLMTLATSLVPASRPPPNPRGGARSPLNPRLIAAAIALLVLGGGGLLMAGDRISDMFAGLSHDAESEAKALSEHNKTAIEVERWEFVSHALDNMAPSDAIKGALSRFKAGTANMERKQDQKAAADFVASREVLSLELRKIEDSQRADALFQLGSVQALRKQFDDLPTSVERERQDARSELKQAERSGGSKSAAENAEAEGLLARARVDLELKERIYDYLTTRVLASTDYSAVQGRFAIADSLLKEQRFTEARVELVAMGKTLTELRKGFETNRSLLEAKYSARKAKAELDAMSNGAGSGSSEEYGRADALMRRGESLAAQADIPGAIAAYGDATPIYDHLVAGAVKAAFARKQAEGEAEVAARRRRATEEAGQRDAAQRQQRDQTHSQQAMQQEMEDKRLKLEREKMERAQQMQERQLQAQQEAESNRMMMQGVGTIFSILGR